MKPHHSRAGVTFIEVLIVVGIIAITAAILFPVFQKVNHQPNRHGSCQSNLKQLGLAITQYTQDSDEVYPAGVNASGNGWAGQVYSYIKYTRVYHCPADAAEGRFVSYAENQRLVRQTLANLAAPAATVELYETTTLNCDPSTPEIVSATGLTAPQNSARHDPNTFALNFLAADGHVRWYKPTQVSSGPGALPTRKIIPSLTGPVLLTFSVK